MSWLKILFLLIGAGIFSSTGLAEEKKLPEEKETDYFKELDASFGEYIVAPLASVMFYDLSFWDNTLLLGEGVGQVIDGNHVLDFKDGKYSLVPQFSIPIDELENAEQIMVGEQISFLWEKEEKKGRVIRREERKTVSFQKTEQGKIIRKDVFRQHVIIDGAEITFSEKLLSNPNNMSLPFVVLWLIFGAIYFTFRMGFINIRGFWHSIQVVRGDFEKDSAEGDVSHFQAFSSALSATVGLGNIAGVAIAVSVGGPGAIFWMIVAGFLGMSSKFTECSLGQIYRRKDGGGSTLGGPMCYLNFGLEELGLARLGRGLAVLFAVMCLGGALGGGNMFQANQAYVAATELFPFLGESEYGAVIYGIILAVLTGIVILGGIKSIGRVAEIMVPVMCGVYLLACGYVLIYHAAEVPNAFGVIFSEAFAAESAFGGLIGSLIQGFRRAAFSNEAGVGSASIAHSAAATDEPISEGIVALLDPFIDTVIICTMTGLVVVLTGAYLDTSLSGVEMTSAAFGSVLSWFPMVLSVAVFFFAFSSMISWSYYGERCATYLFGDRASLPFKLIFLFFVVIGTTITLGNVVEFTDLMILGMAFPNILGLFLLSGKVRQYLDDYWGRLKTGQLKSKV